MTTEKAKCWCFTAFQDALPWYGHKVSYLVYQREICPETNTEHYQGYAEFVDAVTIRVAQRKLHVPLAHMEKRKGKPSQAAAYCMKDDTRKPGCDYVEEGIRRPDPKPGTRTDIIALRDAIQSGKRGFELIDDDTLCLTAAKYIRFTDRLVELCQQRAGREWRTVKTTLLIGSGGSSKTKRALYQEENEDGLCLRKPDCYRVPRSKNLKWFPNYQGETIVVFDDFYGSSCQYTWFLDLFDGHECALETKGGYGYACWTECWITSNVHPDQWWQDHTYTNDKEFKRRITEIIVVED